MLRLESHGGSLWLFLSVSLSPSLLSLSISLSLFLACLALGLRRLKPLILRLPCLLAFLPACGRQPAGGMGPSPCLAPCISLLLACCRNKVLKHPHPYALRLSRVQRSGPRETTRGFYLATPLNQSLPHLHPQPNRTFARHCLWPTCLPVTPHPRPSPLFLHTAKGAAGATPRTHARTVSLGSCVRPLSLSRSLSVSLMSVLLRVSGGCRQYHCYSSC